MLKGPRGGVLLLLLPLALAAFNASECEDMLQRFYEPSFAANSTSSVVLVDDLDVLGHLGVTVNRVFNGSTGLAVLVEATPDHDFTVDFEPMDVAASRIQITIVRNPRPQCLGPDASPLSP